jgi:hypothetical protein
MWDLWWTKAGFLQVLQFPLPICIPTNAPQSLSSPSIIWGWYNRPNSGYSTKWTVSPHEKNKNKTKYIYNNSILLLYTEFLPDLERMYSSLQGQPTYHTRGGVAPFQLVFWTVIFHVKNSDGMKLKGKLQPMISYSRLYYFEFRAIMFLRLNTLKQFCNSPRAGAAILYSYCSLVGLYYTTWWLGYMGTALKALNNCDHCCLPTDGRKPGVTC